MFGSGQETAASAAAVARHGECQHGSMVLNYHATSRLRHALGTTGSRRTRGLGVYSSSRRSNASTPSAWAARSTGAKRCAGALVATGVSASRSVPHVAAVPCGSRSTRTVASPARSAATAMAQARVVIPAPPFWLRNCQRKHAWMVPLYGASVPSRKQSALLRPEFRGERPSGGVFEAAHPPFSSRLPRSS